MFISSSRKWEDRYNVAVSFILRQSNASDGVGGDLAAVRRVFETPCITCRLEEQLNATTHHLRSILSEFKQNADCKSDVVY